MGTDSDGIAFITMYLTVTGYEHASLDFLELEDVARCEVGFVDGHNAINLHTTDSKNVDRVVKFFGADNVVEIAS